jgi:hypothetical protein
MIVVNAFVLPVPVSGTGVRPLNFGTLRPGSTVTILPSAENNGSGAWDVNGLDGKKGVVVSFGLPSVLRSASGAEMKLDWAGLYAGACMNGKRTNCKASQWDPRSPQTFNFQQPWTGGALDVYLGGRAIPAANQPIGTYNATVTLYLAIP